jgi:nucleotide-binding universal stress UspA family protein
MNLQIKRILYATDLSENSSYAFYYAVNLARRFDAKIVILHAVEPFPSYIKVFAATDVEKIENKERRETIENIQNLLQEFCRRAEAQLGSPCLLLVSKILVRIGHPVEEILKIANEEECDTIILGSHGKGLLKQTLLGSVSHGVLHRSRKPVFVIPIPSEKDMVDWNGI